MEWINRSPYLPLVRCWVWATSFQPLELRPRTSDQPLSRSLQDMGFYIFHSGWTQVRLQRWVEACAFLIKNQLPTSTAYVNLIGLTAGGGGSCKTLTGAGTSKLELTCRSLMVEASEVESAFLGGTTSKLFPNLPPYIYEFMRLSELLSQNYLSSRLRI